MMDDKFSSKLIAERLDHVVRDYMLKHDLPRYFVCELWGINDAHLGNVINGRKDISVSMIRAALRCGHVNANWLLGGIGPMYETDCMGELRAQVSQKKRA